MNIREVVKRILEAKSKEYRRNPSYHRGNIDCAVDFSNSIFNFKKYNVINKHIIYSNNEYTVSSRSKPIKNNFYGCKSIWIFDNESQRGVLLEDVAEDWLTNNDLDISIFRSNDFLEQLCITHTLWRLRGLASQLEPYNDYLKKLHEKSLLIRESFFQILLPEVERVSRRYYSKYSKIAFEDVYAMALFYCNIFTFGEDAKNIQENLPLILKDNQRLETKQSLRATSLHSARPYSGSKKHKDKNHYDQARIYLQNIFDLMSVQSSDTFWAYLLTDEGLSSLVANGFNFDHSKVYQPYYEHDLTTYLFGGKGFRNGVIYERLRDFYKSENSRPVTTQYDESVGHVETYSTRKSWSRNQVLSEELSISEKEDILSKALKTLPRKQYEAYKTYVMGEYKGKDTKCRQNLYKARQKIAKLGLDLPI
jgi:hypothetical protein